MEGCDKLCMKSNTVLRKLLETMGLGWPVETSQRRMVSVGSRLMLWNDNPESEVVYVSVSWSSCSAAALAVKSIPCPRVCTALMMT